MKRTICGALVLAAILWNSKCLPITDTESGMLSGAAGGAIIGTIVGDSPGDTLLGAIIGAAIGGAAGAYIEHYMDRQAAEIREEVPGAEVDRVGEGIRIWFDIGVFFDAGGFELRAGGGRALVGLSVILNRYPDTCVYIEGNADDWSDPGGAVVLSERRARVLGDYLARHDVRPGRLSYRKFGPQGHPGGHPGGHRMDMAVVANNDLKSKARSRR